jgi:hypothetical protein
MSTAITPSVPLQMAPDNHDFNTLEAVDPDDEHF